MIYLAAFLASFATVFLKGIQHKNVQHNLYAPTFITSVVIGLADAANISLIVRGGWRVGLVVGIGAGLGMVGAMRIHRIAYGEAKS